MVRLGSGWIFVCCLAFAQFGPVPPGPALPAKDTPLRPAMLLLREGKTNEARAELNKLLKARPEDAEVWYQMARSHLMDFYQGTDPAKQRTALSLAMEELDSTLKRNPDHVYALRAKSIIHARAELLYYDPNLAYQLAARVVQLQPYANEYLLNLAEWMSGEVRFTHESGHRVPHDPQVGLDRSYDLLERVIDGSVPYSPEEAAALFLMAKTLSRRGNHRESIDFYNQALVRAQSASQRMEVLRELGAIQYRLGDYNDAARNFYQALQVHNNSIDQWMLKLCLDQLGAAAPKLPDAYLFPSAKIHANASLNLEFKDIAPDLGINRFDGNGTASWGDYDGDGKPDLFLAGSGTFMSVFRNEGSKFRDVTAETGLDHVPSGYSLNLIDYDNDGKLDLYISYNGWNGPMPNRLYHNTGGRFEDVSKRSGADDAGSGFVSVWGDLDNDGYLDFVVANGVLKDGSVPRIYRNNRDGTFSQVSGVKESPAYGAIGVALGDYDKDGDLDILINGLNNAPNRLYRNDGSWKFTEVARAVGLDQPPHNGFVCFFTDFNNDGWPDILSVSLAPWDAVVEGLKGAFAPASKQAIHTDANRLFRNNGNGTFTDVTWESKLYFPTGSMGAGVADLDNDGFTDIYIGTGDPQLTRLEPNRVFHNNGDATFTDVTSIAGFARPGNKGHGVAFIDIDDDGDIDVYAQLGGHYQGDHAYNAFYKNLKGNRNHWLEVDLTGVKSNRFAVGAQLTVKAGGSTVYREVKGSEGFGATSQYRQHFGLGSKTKVDTLEIRWPSGIQQSFPEIEANRIVAIKEGEDKVTRVK